MREFGMRIKVCQIIPTLVQGGAEKQLTLLAQHLDPERFDVSVIVLTHSGPLERLLRESGVDLHFVEKRRKLDPFAILRLQKILRDLKPDIVHTWLFAGNSYGRFAALRSKVPVILAGERCVDPWKRWHHHQIDAWLTKRTDGIVTNTHAIRDFYAKHGLDGQCFTVIPNAVSDVRAEPVVGDLKNELRQKLFEQLGIPPRKRVVGAIGRLWKQKGYEDIIWSSELLHAAFEDVWIVIFGDGPDREKLMHYRDRVHANRSVKFVGHRQDASELMLGFDLLWNASRYEGQSNTILEAMSKGIPVIASDIPGTRDLIVNHESGVLYPLKDVEALAKLSLPLLKDESLARRVGERAIERVKEHFSLHKMVLAHEQLYVQLYQQKVVQRTEG
jgi:glycosyltransferase involved in cell wall biosynthesis